MELSTCRNCGTPYNVGEVNFCTVCGQPLQTRENLIKEIKRIEREPKPYNALRITASLLIGLGWFIIIVGWLSAVFITGSMIEQMKGFLAVQSGPLFDIASLVFTVLIWSWIAILGLVVIASGQVFLVLLDIRNDMNTTMRLVRRFGLAMLEDKTDIPHDDNFVTSQ